MPCALGGWRGPSVLRIRRETNSKRTHQYKRTTPPPQLSRWEVIQVSRSLQPIVKVLLGLIKSHYLKSCSFFVSFRLNGASWEKESICLPFTLAGLLLWRCRFYLYLRLSAVVLLPLDKVNPEVLLRSEMLRKRSSRKEHFLSIAIFGILPNVSYKKNRRSLFNRCRRPVLLTRRDAPGACHEHPSFKMLALGCG